jgi:hypothetical protein
MSCSEWPSPVRELLNIQASLINVVLSHESLIDKLLTSARTLVPKPVAQIVNSQDCQRETISLVPNRKFQRGVDVTLLFISTDMEEVLTRTVVSQTVHQPRV